MLQNKKMPGTLLVAGIAAYAYYRYTKMTEEEKKNLVGDLKQKGQKLYDQYVPEEIKGFFAKKQEQDDSSFNNANNFTF